MPTLSLKVFFSQLLAGFIMLLAIGSVVGQDEKPNIVLVITDDLGVNDLSCYGRKDQATPNLDKMAAEGIRFTSAYCSQPICSASRAGIMTGMHPARLHLTSFIPGRADAPTQRLLQVKMEQRLALESVTIGEVAKSQGYRTGYIGKWHLGGKGFEPTEQGFDLYEVVNANTKPSDSEGSKGEFELTDKAINFLQQQPGKPFFLVVGHNTPHVPFNATESDQVANKESFNPIYASVISQMDEAIGKLRGALEKSKLSENTLIIFTSDNGGLHVPELPHTPATHNTPFRAGKGYLYEGGTRVPMIAVWPNNIPPGHVESTPISNLDLFPTLAKLMGDASDHKCDGIDLAPLLEDAAQFRDRPFYWHFPHYTNQGSKPSGAIRIGKWKLVEDYESGYCELFDLEADVAESNDIAEKNAGLVAELRGKLEAWRRETRVQKNDSNPAFVKARGEAIYGKFDTTKVRAAEKSSQLAEELAPWRKLMDESVAKGALDPKRVGGYIVLNPSEAKVHGEKLQHEPQPHKDTLGYWVNEKDWAEWEVEIPAAGKYELRILQGCGTGAGGAELEFQIGESSLIYQVIETGHFQRFVNRPIGTLEIKEAGKVALTMKVKAKPKFAVGDVRQLQLIRVD